MELMELYWRGLNRMRPDSKRSNKLKCGRGCTKVSKVPLRGMWMRDLNSFVFRRRWVWLWNTFVVCGKRGREDLVSYWDRWVADHYLVDHLNGQFGGLSRIHILTHVLNKKILPITNLIVELSIENFEIPSKTHQKPADLAVQNQLRSP